MSVYRKILPIITETYGDTPYAADLATHLTGMVEANEFNHRGRQDAIRQKCWIWFSGGDTAASVALRIENALIAHELE